MIDNLVLSTFTAKTLLVKVMQIGEVAVILLRPRF